MPDMKIFAVETSCDETAIALVEAKGSLNLPAGGPQFRILANEVASQIETHRPWGGVVPNLAKREHLLNLPVMFERVAEISSKIDLLAVTVGPGLEPCLWTGINFAKEIHKTYFPKAKLIGANHLEGHLYSFLLSQKAVLFPAIALIISGGHTILLLMRDLTHWKKLGETRDDAAGEAFDKVAKMLGLPYPGGPEIEKLARKGNPEAIAFPRPMMHQKNYDFSFSGLKTAVLYYLQNSKMAPRLFSIGTDRPLAPAASGDLDSRPDGSAKGGDQAHRGSEAFRKKTNEELMRNRLVSDTAASFQAAAADVLIAKTLRAAREFEAKSIMLSGGVSANKFLQKEFRKRIKKEFPASHFLLFTSHFPTDNAAMIAAAAYINHLKGRKRRLIAQPNLSL